MSRALVTGGTGAIGSAVVRRLLADPAYDVRVADRKIAPQWMREGCEVRTGDLREPEQALAAVRGCDCVVHLARPSANAEFSLITDSAALDGALLRAAIDQRVQAFLHVSRAGHGERTAAAFVQLLGERLGQAAHAECGLAFSVCHLSDPLDDVDRAADEIVARLAGA